MSNTKVKIVSKEFRDKRISEKIPLWEGYIRETPSLDNKYMIVELFNKNCQSDFYETFKYKIKTNYYDSSKPNI